MQISARTPAMTAMTALSMAQLSDDRFVLGLGVSGPQVVEGLHGEAFARPLHRLREYVEVVRMMLRGERVAYAGEHYVLPRPGGEGKSLRSSIRPRPDLPIYLATLGPNALELTGEIADGWLGTSFIPEAADVMLGPIRTGAATVGRTLDDIDIQINANVVVTDEVDTAIERARKAMAFTLGGMGSATTNFYNAAYARAGWADDAARVQRLWVAGDKTGATRAVPDELVLQASMLGTEEMVAERVRACATAGVDGLRLAPRGTTSQEQIEDLERSVAVIRGATAR